MTSDGQRFDFIDSLRGLAIFGVVITHVGSHSLVGAGGMEKLLRRIVDLGGMGVPLFYVVSAFTIMLMYSKRYQVEENYIKYFYVRRFMRIAPVYWGGIVLYTLIYGINGSREWQAGPEGWHYLMHLTFMNMTNPITPSSVVPGGWSISNEIIFYLIFPFLFLLVGNLRNSVVLFLCSILLSPLFEVVGRFFLDSFYPGVDVKQRAQFLYRWLPNQFTCFVAGVVFFHIYKNMTGKWVAFLRRIEKRYIAFLLLLGFVSVLSAISVFQINQAWSIFFIALSVAAMVYRWRILVNKYMVYLGKISFSAYIFHFLVIKFSDRYISDVFVLESNVVRFFVLSVVTFFITVVMAHYSYKYYEAFFAKMTDYIIRALKNGNSTVRLG